MTDFVEQCRSEWKRLGVPAALTEEMATELASDLTEARAEGISAEELLGISDPRAFAASWAAERGVIPVGPGRGNARRRPLALVAFTTIAAITLVVATLLLLTGNPKVNLTTTGSPRVHLPAPPAPVVPPGHVVPPANLSAPIEWILLFLALAALAFAAWLWSNWSRTRPPLAPAS